MNVQTAHSKVIYAVCLLPIRKGWYGTRDEIINLFYNFKPAVTIKEHVSELTDMQANFLCMATEFSILDDELRWYREYKSSDNCRRDALELVKRNPRKYGVSQETYEFLVGRDYTRKVVQKIRKPRKILVNNNYISVNYGCISGARNLMGSTDSDNAWTLETEYWSGLTETFERKRIKQGVIETVDTLTQEVKRTRPILQPKVIIPKPSSLKTAEAEDKGEIKQFSPKPSSSKTADAEDEGIIPEFKDDSEDGTTESYLKLLAAANTIGPLPEGTESSDTESEDPETIWTDEGPVTRARAHRKPIPSKVRLTDSKELMSELKGHKKDTSQEEKDYAPPNKKTGKKNKKK